MLTQSVEHDKRTKRGKRTTHDPIKFLTHMVRAIVTLMIGQACASTIRRCHVAKRCAQTCEVHHQTSASHLQYQSVTELQYFERILQVTVTHIIIQKNKSIQWASLQMPAVLRRSPNGMKT